MNPKDFSHIEPKPAATILLARDGAEGLEIFMVKRHREIEFASGAMVFPGGKVEDGDRDGALREACEGAEDLDGGELALRLAALPVTENRSSSGLPSDVSIGSMWSVAAFTVPEIAIKLL